MAKEFTFHNSASWSRLAEGIPAYIFDDNVGLAITSGLCILCLILIITVATYRAIFHPLAHIPGPLIMRITGLRRTYQYMRGEWHNDILDLHNKYGQVVRIAPDEVSVVGSDAMKQLYGHGKSAKKTTWYNTWIIPNEGMTFFAEQESKVHANQRKRVSGAYSMSAILKFEKYIQSCMDLCFSKFQEHANAGTVIDMSSWTNALAFDVVGELAFGQELGQLRSESDLGNIRKTIRDSFWLAANVGHLWGQMSLFTNPLAKTITQATGIPNAIGDFLEWSKKRVNARRTGEDVAIRDDMLAHFLKMKSFDGTGPASDSEIVIEAMNIIGAGADTTSIAIRGCLYLLGRHPDVYRRLQNEVDAFYESNHLIEPITYTQTQQMPFLKAVVSESLRMFPSIVYQLPRYSPAGGITVDARYIPAGYTIGISPIAHNRDKSVYGEDANEFRPERWLESATQTSLLESKNMTFGGNGSRTCIGRNIALVEVNKFVAQLLRSFDFEFVDKEKPWTMSSFWFAYQSDMKMRIKIRPGQHAVDQKTIS